MKKMHTRDVGAAFRAGTEAQSHGSLRVQSKHGLTVAYSYAEPIAIHDGRDTLRSIRAWSTTTAQHIGTCYGPGRTLPATTYMLREVAAGRMSFAEARRHARRALRADAKRRLAAGMPMGRAVEPGLYVSGSVTILQREGRWRLITEGAGEDPREFRTKKAAAVAAFDYIGAPEGWWGSVQVPDFPKAAQGSESYR